jgi:hypothetical protein
MESHCITFKMKFWLEGVVWTNRASHTQIYSGPIGGSPLVRLHLLQKENPGRLQSQFESEGHVECDWIVDRQKAEFVHNFCIGTFDNSFREHTLPFVWNNVETIHASGAISKEAHLPEAILPESLRDIAYQAKSILSEKLHQFLGVARWFHDLDFNTRVVRAEALYWGSNNAELKGVPMKQQSEFPGFKPVDWDGANLKLFQDLLNVNEVSEPIGRSVLSEAREAYDSGNERVAVILSCVALEAGAKSYASRLLPDFEWIFEELQLPRVDTFIKKFLLPKAFERAGKEFNSAAISKLMKDIGTLIESRNKYVHLGHPKGKNPPQNFIEIVSDVLYLLDVLSGHEWAKAHIGSKFLQELNWQSATDDCQHTGRVSVVFSTE